MAEREMFRVEGMKDREMWKTMTKEIMENDKITTKDPEFMKKRQIVCKIDFSLFFLSKKYENLIDTQAIDFFERAAAQSNSLALVELAFLHDIIGKNYEAVEYTKVCYFISFCFFVVKKLTIDNFNRKLQSLETKGLKVGWENVIEKELV